MLYKEENIIKVLDYNVRCANDGINKVTGSNNDIDHRAPRLEALIKEYQPDVIGLQEASRPWIKELEERLYRDYAMRYTYRAPHSRESTPVLWRRDKFELLDDGHFWMSETPDTPSIGWGSGKWCRICTWVKLRVKATGKEFFYVSAHMTGSVPGTVNGGNVVMEQMANRGAFSECGAFLTGDFNIPPGHEGYVNLQESGRFSDLNADLGMDWQYSNNGYNDRPDEDPKNWIKDFIFYTPAKMVPLKYKVLNEYYFDGWISDHRGLWGEVAIKE